MSKETEKRHYSDPGTGHWMRTRYHSIRRRYNLAEHSRDVASQIRSKEQAHIQKRKMQRNPDSGKK